MVEPGAPLKRILGFIAAKDPGVRQRTGFSISSLGVCMAKQLFAIAGYPITTPRMPRMMILWRLGMLIEREVVALLREAGEVVIGLQKEYVGSEPPREGHIDGLILRDGKLYPFDVKSSNKNSFDKWVQAGGVSPWKAMRVGWAAFDPRLIEVKSYRPVREVSPAYYWQAQGYMEMLRSRPEYRSFLLHNVAEVSDELAAAAENDEVPVATDGFYFFVYCKDNSTLYEEFVPFDEEAISKRLEEAATGFKVVEGKRRSKTLAAKIRTFREMKPETKKGELGLPWQCRRCDFTQTCWDDRQDIKGVTGDGT